MIFRGIRQYHFQLFVSSARKDEEHIAFFLYFVQECHQTECMFPVYVLSSPLLLSICNFLLASSSFCEGFLVFSVSAFQVTYFLRETNVPRLLCTLKKLIFGRFSLCRYFFYLVSKLSFMCTAWACIKPTVDRLLLWHFLLIHVSLKINDPTCN